MNEKKIKYCPVNGQQRHTHQGWHLKELREAAKRRRRVLNTLSCRDVPNNAHLDR